MRLIRFLVTLFPALVLASAAGGRTGTGPGGYVWKDCEEIDGPACDYVITAASDGLTGLCSDELYSPFGGLGFPFPYYGTTFSNFTVSGNGVIYLSNPPGGDAANAALTGLEGRPTIAPLWDDWAMDNDDELVIICGDPGCSNSGPLTFVESYRVGSGVDPGGVAFRDIEWFDTAKHRPNCSEPLTATFGLRLYADGRILFNYMDVEVGQPLETDWGVSATIGISRGFLGEHSQVAFDTAFVPYVPYAILFEPPCAALRCNSITSPDDACAGDDVPFRANVGGGTPPYEVAWDFDGDTLPEITGNPVNWPLPAGIVTVTATVTDACPQPPPGPSCSMSKPIDVHALPVPVVSASGPTSFCAADGESVNLLADVGYAFYRWTRDGGDIPGATGRVLSTSTSGSHVVHDIDAFGCEGASAPILVNADDCAARCPPLACGAITATPATACEGESQELMVDVSGGVPPYTVAWDLDGDTVPDDAFGNPATVTLPPGSTRVHAVVADSCADPNPNPQVCDGYEDVTVGPGAAALGEISGAGEPPLLVRLAAGAANASLDVEDDPDATAYHAYVDGIGSWWAPSDPTGRRCAVIPTGAGPRSGTVVIEVPLPADSWVVVVAANPCGEGPAGSSSRGVARETGTGWTACGPAP